MPSWFSRLTGIAGPGESLQSPTVTPRQGTFSSSKSSTIRHKDPNVPLKRLQLHQKCLYERNLPGNAFVSAHVSRLQRGYYASTAIHEPPLENVYFISVHFVFHPYDNRAHRFKSAMIRVSVFGDEDSVEDPKKAWSRPALSHPRILKHAPQLIYGAVSPETLQWNFSLSSSLGVSQTPLVASLSPSGGVVGSYKVFDMMSIQGSIRSIASPFGPEYDIEDALAVWTLQENQLQRSGLPREFDFVLLVHKPDDPESIYLNVEVDASVEAWWGEYPQWYNNINKYRPTQNFTLDFDTDVGQRFLPITPGRGFNFADLPQPLEEYVLMPGTTYPTDNTTRDDGKGALIHRPRTSDQQPPTWTQKPSQRQALPAPQQPSTPTRSPRVVGQHPASNRHSWVPDTINVRVMLEHNSPQPPSSHRYSGSPTYGEPTRHRSIRRTRSRAGLKEYGAQQALQEIARETLNGNAG